MSRLLSKPEYEAQTASTRDERMQWWRRARFGMFVHFGLYALEGRNEWLQAHENIPVKEYEKYADAFCPKPGAAYEWCALAREAGMKYVVLTTRHHDGFSLWDSKANPYNSVNYGPHRDIVAEFVEACRAHDLKIGFYSSLMDWHHPDAWKCAFDDKARRRFLDYIEALNTELLTQYGKIDILWYDVARPMEHWEGWDSLARNQRLRALQPHILINNRSRLDEDFGTPEGRITVGERDWEACMTFNGISWGYVDEQQALPYAYNAQQILRMLNTCVAGGGNLLLNIGPAPDGSAPRDAIAPLRQVGAWLKDNGEAVYGDVTRTGGIRANGVTGITRRDNTLYLWSWIWPRAGEMALGGFLNAPRKITLLASGEPVEFEVRGQRILLKNLPLRSPDEVCGITVLKAEFDEPPMYRRGSYYPQLHGGEDIAGENKL